MSNSRTQRRRGVAIIPIIAFYAVAMTLIAVWFKGAVREQRQVARWHDRSQTVLLAEAGLHRAIARVKQGGTTYAGEQWQVSKADLESRYDAHVDIRVTSMPSTDRDGSEVVRIIAIADYPAGTDRKIRITKESVFNLRASGQSSSGE